MKRCFLLILASFFVSFSSMLQALEPKVVQVNDLMFWTETFGNKKDPALLLIMGNGGQGLLWPQEFCEKLSEKGYFVIRYDNRDVGLSDSVDFNKNPYTLLDMAKDANGILDHYQIKKAHIIGASMGGEIATLFAAHFPTKVQTLTLMCTSSDMRSVFDTLEGKPSNSSLSKPKEAYLAWVKSYVLNMPKSLEGKLEKFVEGGRILNGSKAPFDEVLYRELGMQSFIRTKNPDSVRNHSLAMKQSYDLHEKSFAKIKVPTLILHGDEDPIFGVDHAYALNKAIANSKLVIIPSLGHAATPHFFEDFSKNILGFIKD
jgi:pimeloyl-ACP methyl ester carboxylesterase